MNCCANALIAVFPLSLTLVPLHPQEKDKGTRLAYVAPTIPRRLASTTDIDEKENR